MGETTLINSLLGAVKILATVLSKKVSSNWVSSKGKVYSRYCKYSSGGRTIKLATATVFATRQTDSIVSITKNLAGLCPKYVLIIAMSLVVSACSGINISADVDKGNQNTNPDQLRGDSNMTDVGDSNMTDGGGMDNMTDGGGMDNMTDGGGMDNMTDGGGMDNMTDGGGMDNMTDGGGMDNMTDGGGMDNMTDGGDMDNMTAPIYHNLTVASSSDLGTFPIDANGLPFGTGSARVIQIATSGTEIGTLVITDLDINKSTSGTHTYTLINSRDAANLLQWQTSSINTTGTTQNRTNKIVLSRMPTSSDIGTHHIDWEVADSLNDGRASIEGNFTLEVVSLDDASTDIIINFIDSTRLAYNLNDYDAGSRSHPLNQSNFTLEFIITDDDLLEPDIDFNAATYASTDFTIRQPGVTDDIICSHPQGSANDPINLIRDPFIKSKEISNKVKHRGGVASADGNDLTLGDLITYDASITTAGECVNPRIGSTIIGVAFNDVKVSIPAGYPASLGRIVANSDISSNDFPAYTIHGYRQHQPTMSVASNDIRLLQDSYVDLEVTLTDTDSDDGYFGVYDNAAIVRGDDIGAAWGNLSIGSNCASTGIIVNSPTDFSTPINDPITATATTNQSIRIQATDTASGSCSLTISSTGEDGVAPANALEVTISVQIPNIPAPPSLRITSTPSIPENFFFAYGADVDPVLIRGFRFITTDGDQDANPISFTTTSITTDVCTLADGQISALAGLAGLAERALNVALSIVPLRQGNCRIQVTATEDNLTSEPITFDFDLTALAPQFFLTLERDAAPFTEGFAKLIYEVDITANPVAPPSISPPTNLTGTLKILTPETCGEAERFGKIYNSINTGSLVVKFDSKFFVPESGSAQSQTTRAGDCRAIFFVRDENYTANITLTNSFNFPEFPPLIGIGNYSGDFGDIPEVTLVDKVAGIYVNATIQDQAGDTTGVDWRISTSTAGCAVSLARNSEVLALTSPYSGRASDVFRLSTLDLSGLSGTEDGHIYVRVTDGVSKTCSVTLSASDDGQSGPVASETFSVLFREYPPTATPIAITDFTLADYADPITYTTTIASADDDDSQIQVTVAVANADASVGQICTATLRSNQASEVLQKPNEATVILPTTGGEVTVFVNPIGTGDCVVSLFAEEDGARTNIIDNVAIILPELKPTVALVTEDFDSVNQVGSGFITVNASETAEFRIVATKRDPSASGVAFSLGATLSDDCRISFAQEPIEYTGSGDPGNVGKIATLAFQMSYVGELSSGSAICETNITLTEDDLSPADRKEVSVKITFQASSATGTSALLPAPTPAYNFARSSADSTYIDSNEVFLITPLITSDHLNLSKSSYPPSDQLTTISGLANATFSFRTMQDFISMANAAADETSDGFTIRAELCHLINLVTTSQDNTSLIYLAETSCTTDLVANFTTTELMSLIDSNGTNRTISATMPPATDSTDLYLIEVQPIRPTNDGILGRPIKAIFRPEFIDR